MTRWIRAIATLAVLSSVGFVMPAMAHDEQPDSHTDAAQANPSIKQTHCPVTPTEEIDPEVYTDYKGQRIYFCCERCKVKFNKDPEQYVARLNTQQVSEPVSTDSVPDAHFDHDHSDHHHDDSPSEASHKHGDGHDHTQHSHGTGSRWTKWLGGFHPPMVNFPIGVLVAGVFAELLFMFRPRPELNYTARFCVMFAALTGVAAGVLGWLFGGLRIADADPLLAVHRWLGTGTVLWLIALLVVSERTHRALGGNRRLLRVFLFGGAVLVLATGFFGGAMVYGLEHYLP